MFDNKKQLLLFDSFQKVKGSFPTDKHKYIHVKTVENLIEHIDNFTNDAQKDGAYNVLTDYIDYLNNNTILNGKDSQAIFMKYINPLTKIYSDTLDFHLAVKPFWIILATVFFSLVLYLLHSSELSYCILIIIVLFIWFRHI